ncbi:DUF4129 domain-containing protein [Streptosporangium roseum]|uniref:Protein-glutamine gamma-glutamyltransferase-like C-terminal domain-containing protein n=1 Tax=Streptosporangium roseum (strain ATCC 12428 / DSM 43021 / JCM 3005 / KCTC 9067 / NCIMB 10171 / NRRL 2505 / NI 9100) TaxID=479432 RepID=D2AUW4_STRRD|nr:DUF4129 domain-containing protein [Streptosporangium roseum]ACZ86826.1 hypothetical protein Sros_3909 [Streptosporangium roseum DSM 43021]
MRRSGSSSAGRWHRWTPFALAVAGLTAVALAADGIRLDGAFDLGVLVPEPPVRSPVPVRNRSADVLPVGEDPTGRFAFWAVVVIGAMLAAPVIVMLVRMLMRSGDRPPAVRPAQERPAAAAEMRAALRAGLTDLDAGDDPRRAVIACWLRLEHAAAGAGTPRLAADTPGDLVTRLLAAHRVSGPALGRLAAAYRQARYAPHEVTGSLRGTARRALAEVDAELSP